MTVFCDVSDIRTREMLKLPVPALKGDKPRTVTCKPSEALRAFVRSLVKRAERLKTERVDPREDNMLMIANEGRLAALDMRLINSRQPADPGGKVAQCAREVHDIWQQTAGLKRAQLVFCDLSSPKGGKSFICLASTYERKGVRKSRIVLNLTPGNVVTTPRAGVSKPSASSLPVSQNPSKPLSPRHCYKSARTVASAKAINRVQGSALPAGGPSCHLNPP